MKINKKLFPIAVIAVIITVVTVMICVDYDRNMKKQSVDLYFMTKDGASIIAEPSTVRYKDENDLIYAIIEALKKGPDSDELGEIMPESAVLNGIGVKGNRAVSIDLSADFLTEDPSRNVLSAYAITKSLCSTGKVLSVKITADGTAITDPDGEELGFVAASDINLETEEYYSELREVALYFANSDGSGLVREDRTIKITDQQPIEQYIINELIKGPGDKELKPILSGKTSLLSVDLADNICYLNFKSNFISENTGSEQHERLVIYSIVNSLTELQTISRVQFYMDGKRVDNFGSFNIKDYIHRDIGIIEE